MHIVRSDIDRFVMRRNCTLLLCRLSRNRECRAKRLPKMPKIPANHVTILRKSRVSKRVHAKKGDGVSSFVITSNHGKLSFATRTYRPLLLPSGSVEVESMHPVRVRVPDIRPSPSPSPLPVESKSESESLTSECESRGP